MSSSRSRPSAVRMPLSRDLHDRLGDHLGAGLGEGRVVGVRHRDPLAAERVGGGELRPQLGIVDLAAEMVAGDLLEDPGDPPVDDRSQHGRLLEQRRSAREPLAERPAAAGRGAARARSPARSASGITQTGVRWNRCSERTRGWISGTICTAEAPVPITATRSPSRSCAWSQRAEWNIAPRKRSRPGISGARGSVSPPIAATRTFAVSSPAEVSSRQSFASSSQRAPLTSCEKRMWGTTPRSSCHPVQVLADLRLQGIGAAPVGIGRERERVERGGDVALAPGIGVVAPGAAELGRPLEDEEVVGRRPPAVAPPCRFPRSRRR